ncbi:MAG TPA: hypothetical protein VF215_10290 [Thermoanaerobaculia bacterium]
MLSSWQATFKITELQFFQQPESNWIAVLNTTLNDLDENYADNHPGHVFVLNQRLSLVPPLREQDFDGDITVADLALNVIEPRISVANLTLPPVAIPRALAHVDFGDLNVFEEDAE